MSQRYDESRSFSEGRSASNDGSLDALVLVALLGVFVADLTCPPSFSCSRLYAGCVLLANRGRAKPNLQSVTFVAIGLILARLFFVAQADWSVQLLLSRTFDIVLIGLVALFVAHWSGASTIGRIGYHDLNELRESERRLRGISNNLPQGAIYQLQRWPNNSRRFVHLSKGLEKSLALTIEEMYQDANSFFSRVPPDDIIHMDELGRESAVHGTQFDCEFRFRKGNGEIRWLEFHSTPRYQLDLSIVWDGVILDITKRKRTERVVSGQNRVMHSIVMGEPLSETLEHVVSVVEEQIPGSMCSILMFDEKRSTLTFGAGRRLPAEYSKAIDGLKIGPSVGSCGTAAHSRTPVLSDIDSDPRWDSFRELASRHGLRTCWSIPILSVNSESPTAEATRVRGTFAIYMQDRWVPDAEATKIVEKAADLASVAIERATIFQSMRDSEERYRELVELAPDAVGIIQEGEVVYCNQHSAKMMRSTSVNDLIGKRLVDLIHPDDVEASAQWLQLVKEFAQSVTSRLFHVRRFDGTWCYVDICAGLSQFNGSPAVQMIARDVSDRIRTEMQLRATEQRFSKIFHASPVGISITEFASGKVIDINDTFLRILGVQREELISDSGATFTSWLSNVDRQQMLQELALSGSLKNWEHTFRRGDGTIGTSLRNLERMELDGQDCILTMFIDITERKKLDDELRTSRQRLEALSRQLITSQETERGVLSHELHDELGQVLTAIRMSLRRIQSKQEPLSPSDLEQSVELIDQSIQQVRKLSLQLRPLQLDQLGLVAALHWLINQQAQIGSLDKHLAVNLQDFVVPSKLSTICFRVTQEALINTVRHASAKSIEVDLSRRGEELVLMICDDGCGFDVETARQRSADGASLGLSTMQERVSLVGGKIQIESNPLSGTMITVRLPLSDGMNSSEIERIVLIDSPDALTRVRTIASMDVSET